MAPRGTITPAAYAALIAARPYVGRRGRLPSPPAAAGGPSLARYSPDGRAVIIPPAAGTPVPAPVDIGSAGGSRGITSTAGLVTGWTVRETSGAAPAALVLYDAAGASGLVLAAAGLAAGASDCPGMFYPGLLASAGVYLDVVSGAFEGSLWWLPLAGVSRETGAG